MISGVLADVVTGYLESTRLDRYRYSNRQLKNTCWGGRNGPPASMFLFQGY